MINKIELLVNGLVTEVIDFRFETSGLPEGNHLITLKAFNDSALVDVQEVNVVVADVSNIYYIDYDPTSTEDQGDYVNQQLALIPNGTSEVPNIIMFNKGGRIKAEGHLDPLDGKSKTGVFEYRDKAYWHITCPVDNPVTFYTTEPRVPHGGDIDNNTHSARKQFWFHQSVGLTFTNFIIEGSNSIDGGLLGTAGYTPSWYPYEEWRTPEVTGYPKYVTYWEGEHGFDFRECQDVLVQNVTIKYQWGDGIYVGGSGGSSNVVLKDCTIKWSGRQGIGVANNVDGLTIDNIWFDHIRRSSIDLEPHTQGGWVRNVHIKNCRNATAWFQFLAAGGSGEVSNVLVEDCEHNGTMVRCLGNLEAPRAGWTIRRVSRIDNAEFANGQANFLFSNTNDIVIDNNHQPIALSQSRVGVHFTNCHGVLQVTNNNFVNATRVHADGGTVRENILIEGNSYILPQYEVTPQPIIDLTGYEVLHRINTGGTETTVGSGTFSADSYFSGGDSRSRSSVDILETTDDAIYLSYRQNGPFNYNIPVANGNYLVVIHMSEHYNTQPYKRIFNVDAQGERWLTDYDIVGYVGAANTSRREAKAVSVTDGVLSLNFLNGPANDSALLNAIEVYSAVV